MDIGNNPPALTPNSEFSDENRKSLNSTLIVLLLLEFYSIGNTHIAIQHIQIEVRIYTVSGTMFMAS